MPPMAVPSHSMRIVESLGPQETWLSPATVSTDMWPCHTHGEEIGLFCVD